jgi:outer membrane protein TolC
MRSFARFAALGVVCAASTASAQQPLSRFLQAAADHAVDVRVARASAREARSRVDERRAALLPSLSLAVGYTRNQQEVVAQFPSGGGTPSQAVLTARDQLTGHATLEVPVVDVAGWSALAGAEFTAEAHEARLEATRVDVSLRVVDAYYRLVAARGVADAAARNLAFARRHASAVEARLRAGTGSELERQQALADVARAEGARAEARLEVALASRRLEVLTGLTPSGVRVSLRASLEPEPPLARWTQAQADPAVRAAARDREAAERARDAAWQRMLPVVRAFATERYTNAAGFGPDFLWSVGAEATWLFDFGQPAALSTRERALERAEAEEARAQRRAETGVYQAWHRVRANLARARAARAGEAASERALVAARAGYEAGTVSPLELIHARRERFAATVERLRADADLRAARLTLRLRSGLPPRLEATP